VVEVPLSNFTLIFSSSALSYLAVLPGLQIQFENGADLAGTMPQVF
jgi:hypothetical protein